MTSTNPADISPRRPDGVEFADADAERQLAGAVERLAWPDDAFERVKHNASRTVWRGAIDGQLLYVKHFHPRSAWGRLRRRLGVSDARRELRLARRLRQGGVPAPRILAVGRAGNTEWVASEAVTNAEPADAWHARVRAKGDAGIRPIRSAIRTLAETLARMHALGVVHRDLHCGNLLVRRSDAGEVSFVVMDLHRTRRSRGRRARASNLAQLLHDRRDFTTRTDRLRFLRAYLRAAGLTGQLRGWQMLIEELARRHTARQYAHRDRRIARTNRYFARVRLPRGWRGHVVLASKRKPAESAAAHMQFSPDAWRDALAHPEALMDGDVEVVKDSATSRVVRRKLTIGGRELDVYVKRSHRKRAWKVLLDCFRRGRGVRAFRLGHMLLTRRIATAFPLAGLERRRGPFLLDTIYLTEAVEAPRLSRFLELHLGRAADAKLDHSQRRQLAQAVLWQLGRLVQGLHDHGFAHRDLKAPNMLVHWRAGELPQIVLVDLDGLRQTHVLTVRRRFQGLMRLNVSLLKCPVVTHAGRLRMLLGYLRRPGCGWINFKPYWRVLEVWSARKLNRQIRSRRRRQRALRRPTS
ncbi:MAG: hypothetical protein KGY99_05655 [Phycisphaerae bacterium]|nr:hypothetical protein [Phycisphaerae bacterium]